MPDSPKDLYLVGLRNAHAIEAMATEMLERQIQRLETYPEVAEAMRAHLEETHHQSERLEGILKAHGSDYSTLKENWLALTGNVAAMFHGIMQDEVMKNHFANAGVEAYESAMYTALIAMAEQVGDGAAIGPLRQSLAEEQKVAKLIQDMTPALTAKYVALTAAGATAGV